jgi:branched-subunit amino acid ABC-type transport system permease component
MLMLELIAQGLVQGSIYALIDLGLILVLMARPQGLFARK